jgi:hypothetical protein
MRNTVMTLFLVLAFSMALTAAQDQSQPQTEDQSSTYQQNQENHVTITGCLQKGAAPDSFVLNNVGKGMSQRTLNDQGSSEGMDQAQGNQGTEPSENMPSEMARSESSYALVPEGKINFSDYIGQQVEVTGTMMPALPRANTPDDMSQNSQNPQNDSSMNNQPEIRVNSIRQISRSCQ